LVVERSLVPRGGNTFLTGATARPADTGAGRADETNGVEQSLGETTSLSCQPTTDVKPASKPTIIVTMNIGSEHQALASGRGRQGSF
jgi:hypothetical protein